MSISRSEIALSKLVEHDFETSKNTGQENSNKLLKFNKIW